MAFPTLSTLPSFPLKQSREDYTIKSSMEAGVIKTRARYTRSRKTFQLQYQNLTAADIVLLDAHLDEVLGITTSFSWTNPATNVTYTVRYGNLPEYELTGHNGVTYQYNTSFSLVEV